MKEVELELAKVERALNKLQIEKNASDRSIKKEMIMHSSTQGTFNWTNKRITENMYTD